MKKKWVIVIGVLVLVQLVFFLGAWRLKSEDHFFSMGSREMAYDAQVPHVSKEEMSAGARDSFQGEELKQITNIRYEFITKDFQEKRDLMKEVSGRHGAILSQMDEGTLYHRSDSTLRYANFMFRVPTDKLDAFLQDLEKGQEIRYKNYNLYDVTSSYQDVEGRLANLRAREERLRGLYEKAQSVSDMVSIEEALSQVSWEIENLTSQKQSFDRDIDFTSVSIYLEEVPTYQNTGSGSFLDSLKNALAEGVWLFVDGLRWLILLLASFWPFLILLSIVAIIGVRVFKKKKSAKQ